MISNKLICRLGSLPPLRVCCVLPRVGKLILIGILSTVSLTSFSQSITVKATDFKSVLNKALDMGYMIEQKDSDLGTATTYPCPTHHNLIVYLRVRPDSTMILSGAVYSSFGIYKIDPGFKKPWRELEAFAAETTKP